MNITGPSAIAWLALCLWPLSACPQDGPGTADAMPDSAATVDTAVDTEAETSDGDVAADISPCTLSLSAETTEIALGGRAILDVTTSDGPAELTVDVPEGYRGRIDDATSRLLLFAPYSAQAQPQTVTVAAPCGATAELTVSIRAPLWKATPAWNAAQDGPLGREYFNMWIDALNPDRLLLFGGFHYVPQQFTTSTDMWSYDLAGTGGWTELDSVGPPELAGGRLALVPQTQQGIHFGGIRFGDQGALLPFSLSVLDYGADPPLWSTLNPDNAPGSGTYQPAFFYDAPRDRFLAVGGQGAAGTHMDVFVLDREANTWLQTGVAGDEQPSGRTGFFWVHDQETERFIAFSGEQGGAASGCNCAQDTWALELAEFPPRWVKLQGPQNPPLGRRNGAYALDPVGHRMLVWGGTADGMNSFPGLWALTLDRGHERWDEIQFPAGDDGPTVRASGGLVYDAARNRFLAGFGNDSTVGAYEDLWALEL